MEQPLSARRNEHERCRKQIKETWHRELKRMQESVGNLRKAKALYVQRQQEWERAKEAAQRAENAAESSTEQASKLDKRKKTEEDALQKVLFFFYFSSFLYFLCTFLQTNQRRFSILLRRLLESHAWVGILCP